MLDYLQILNSTDVMLFYLINIHLQNPVFDILMPIITNLGLYIFWVGVCLVLAIFGGKKGRDVALLLIIGVIIGYFLSDFLKVVFNRPRPFMALTGVHQLATAGNFSFPSGHATEIVIACIILAKKYGHIWIFMLLAIIIGFSRVYIGVHYPGDVISGALLGASVAFLVLYFDKDILKLKNRLEIKE